MALLITSDVDIHQVITDMLNPRFDTKLQYVEGLITTVSKALSTDPSRLNMITWDTEFLYVGNWAINENTITFDGFDEEAFTALLVSKHRRYGDKPIRAFGCPGVVIRIASKLERYEYLAVHPGDTGDEPLQDTLLDILGYAILGYLLAKELDNEH